MNESHVLLTSLNASCEVFTLSTDTAEPEGNTCYYTGSVRCVFRYISTVWSNQNKVNDDIVLASHGWNILIFVFLPDHQTQVNFTFNIHACRKYSAVTWLIIKSNYCRWVIRRRAKKIVVIVVVSSDKPLMSHMMSVFMSRMIVERPLHANMFV